MERREGGEKGSDRTSKLNLHIFAEGVLYDKLSNYIVFLGTDGGGDGIQRRAEMEIGDRQCP